METLSKIGAALKVGVTITNAGQLYAALRGLLVAVGLLLTLFGFGWLTPGNIEKILQIASAAGVVLGALSTFVGLLLVIIPPLIASFKASPQERVNDTRKIAEDPTASNSNEAAKALVSATASIAQNNAPLAEDAKQALLAATIAQPSVQTIITDKSTADAAPSNDIVAAKE